jgi:hypothetical protein
VSFICGNVFGIGFLGVMKIGLIFLWAGYYLNFRGQQLHQFFFGLKTVNCRTGKPCSWWLVSFGLYFITLLPFISLSFLNTQNSIIVITSWFIVNFLAGYFDKEGRLLTDKLFGVVVAFKD